jgi:hypothetical protein
LLTTFGVGWLAALCWGGVRVLHAPSAAAATTERAISLFMAILHRNWRF